MESILNPTIIQILIQHLEPKDLSYLSSVNRKFQSFFQKYGVFWKTLFMRDFGERYKRCLQCKLSQDDRNGVSIYQKHFQKSFKDLYRDFMSDKPYKIGKLPSKLKEEMDIATDLSFDYEPIETSKWLVEQIHQGAEIYPGIEIQFEEYINPNYLNHPSDDRIQHRVLNNLNVCRMRWDGEKLEKFISFEDINFL